MYTANVGFYKKERKDIPCYTVDKMLNSHYSSRLYKILSHIFDPSEYSVYVDADIFLTEEKEKQLIEELKSSGKLVGVFKHPWRDCIYDEAKEILRLGKDEKSNVNAFLKGVREDGWPEHKGLAACGILVRKNCIETMKRNESWWAFVCSTSKRDQLSFPIVWDGEIHYFDGNIYGYKK